MIVQINYFLCLLQIALAPKKYANAMAIVKNV